jgi:hypothetical protein
VQWQAGRAHGCHDRRGRLGRDRGRPAEVAGRGRRDRPGKPQHHGNALGDHVHRDQGAGLDHMAIGTQVEDDRHRHRSFGRSRFDQLGAHAGQSPALQPRDVHLREADPGRDLVLVQVLEEPQDDDLALQLRQGSH